MRAWGNMMELVLATLREHGPQTRVQLQERLGATKSQMSQIVKRMTKIAERPVAIAGRRRAHIIGWARGEHEGARSYPRPIYAYGHGAMTPKPARQTVQQVNARHWANQKARQQIAAAEAAETQ